MKEAEGGTGGEDGCIEGETDEGENVFERTAIIDWALRISNGWMDDGGTDGGREVEDEWRD